MTDFLDEKRNEITARMAELKPLVEEHRRLESAVAALDGIPNGASVASPRSTLARRGPGRPRGSKTNTAPASPKPPSTAKPTARRGRGRRKGTGSRGAEALALIDEHPGITILELAARMGIKQNYLYRVLPTLAKEHKVVKDGSGYYPKRTASAAA